jgi:hypothetical protein
MKRPVLIASVLCSLATEAHAMVGSDLKNIVSFSHAKQRRRRCVWHTLEGAWM